VLIAGVMLIGLYPQPRFDAVDTSTATLFGEQVAAESGR